MLHWKKRDIFLSICYTCILFVNRCLFFGYRITDRDWVANRNERLILSISNECSTFQKSCLLSHHRAPTNGKSLIVIGFEFRFEFLSFLVLSQSIHPSIHLVFLFLIFLHRFCVVKFCSLDWVFEFVCFVFSSFLDTKIKTLLFTLCILQYKTHFYKHVISLVFQLKSRIIKRLSYK